MRMDVTYIVVVAACAHDRSTKVVDELRVLLGVSADADDHAAGALDEVLHQVDEGSRWEVPVVGRVDFSRGLHTTPFAPIHSRLLSD
jgi:hypothetical protein